MKQDQLTLDRIAKLHPMVKEEVYNLYKELCFKLTGAAICRFSHTLRTFQEQDELYSIGRRGKKGEKVVTNAKGGQSYHNYGLAIDIVLLVDRDKNGTFESASFETSIDFDGDGRADWREVVDIFKRYGWEWGGDWQFKDVPHFQKTFGKSISQLQQIKLGGRLDREGYVIL